MRKVLIAGPVRTPLGELNGSLAGVNAVRLGIAAAGESLRRAGIEALQPVVEARLARFRPRARAHRELQVERIGRVHARARHGEPARRLAIAPGTARCAVGEQDL
jgi:acetyl-CoA acetyltransferase